MDVRAKVMERLPMELWAHVASFLPFERLVPTFWALRRAGMLPATYTTPSHSLLQFCACHSARDDEAADESFPPLDAPLDSTLREWFGACAVDDAMRLCRGQPDAVLEYLMRRYT